MKDRIITRSASPSKRRPAVDDLDAGNNQSGPLQPESPQLPKRVLRSQSVVQMSQTAADSKPKTRYSLRSKRSGCVQQEAESSTFQFKLPLHETLGKDTSKSEVSMEEDDDDDDQLH